MRWFKHDSDAFTDAKIRRLISKHGATGYAVYFHCIELICGDVCETNISFMLEHDASTIADDLKIKGGESEVCDILNTCASLNLFEIKDGNFYCYKLLYRIDSSMISPNGNLRTLLTKARESVDKSHDQVMTKSCPGHDQVMRDYTRLDYTRLEDTKKEDIYIPSKKSKKEPKKPTEPKTNYCLIEGMECLLTEKEYTTLSDKYDQDGLTGAINKVASYAMSTGKSYKSHYAVLINWGLTGCPLRSRPKPEGTQCPYCDDYLPDRWFDTPDYKHTCGATTADLTVFLTNRYGKIPGKAEN